MKSILQFFQKRKGKAKLNLHKYWNKSPFLQKTLLMNILVTGAKGQLGSELKKLHHSLEKYHFFFADFEELDITDEEVVRDFFRYNKISHCINCAAYTAVDKAENEAYKAEVLNAKAVRLLTEQCAEQNATLIHISTDYVFDGKNYTPYTEVDVANPINVYGKTKFLGEQMALSKNPKTIVIRTSWLYSTFGNNFVKTMLRLAETTPSISVVADQVGTPTYAEDLARAILQIINTSLPHFGIYHYSNEGVASWYDFAHAIFQIKKLSINLIPIKTEAYPTPAKRPAYSILDKSKIKQTFRLTIPHWRESLEKCLKSL
jgi:dTDP-4-dehydrorhamnose reductase